METSWTIRRMSISSKKMPICRMNLKIQPKMWPMIQSSMMMMKLSHHQKISTCSRSPEHQVKSSRFSLCMRQRARRDCARPEASASKKRIWFWPGWANLTLLGIFLHLNSVENPERKFIEMQNALPDCIELAQPGGGGFRGYVIFAWQVSHTPLGFLATQVEVYKRFPPPNKKKQKTKKKNY